MAVGKPSNYSAVTLHDLLPPRRGFGPRVRRLARHGILSLLGGLPGAHRAEQSLRCLVCHGLFPDEVDNFDAILRQLLELGRFVDTDTALAMGRGERPIDGRCFHLSVDDGMHNNLSHLAPALKRFEIPALFFVTTAFADQGFAGATTFSRNARYATPVNLLSWEDCGQLLAMGFEIGSHTRHHLRLSTVSEDPERLCDELEGSKRELETRLGIDCRFFAWPFGTLDAIDARGFAAIEQAGYEASFGAFRGRVTPGPGFRQYSIPRHQIEPSWPVSHVRTFALGRWGE